MTNPSGNHQEESIEEKIALLVRLLRCGWYLCTPVIFLLLMFLFGSKKRTSRFLFRLGRDKHHFVFDRRLISQAQMSQLLYDRMGKSLPDNYR